MTNKQKAQALWDTVMDRSLTNAEHRIALDSLAALKKAAKTTLIKLGIPEGMWERENQRNLDNQELEADMAADQEAPAPAPALAPAPVPAPVAAPPVTTTSERGFISAAVKSLLSNTDLPYAEIAETVRAEFPHAKTTSRSIASVASDMRAAGLSVSIRRPAAKAKSK